MAKSAPVKTLCDENFVEGYPDAPQRGAAFFHAGGVTPGAAEILRGKGYTLVDFRSLTGEEKVEAMIEAAQNGVFEPSAGQIKLIDTHLKQIHGKDDEEEAHSRQDVLGFLDLLQEMASRERPEWAKVGVAPTQASSTPKVEPPEVVISNLMADIEFDPR